MANDHGIDKEEMIVQVADDIANGDIETIIDHKRKGEVVIYTGLYYWESDKSFHDEAEEDLDSSEEDSTHSDDEDDDEDDDDDE